jgi:hypothetical protein
MNIESSTATLLSRTQNEPLQPPRPRFSTPHLNAWFDLNAAVAKKVGEREVEIKRILADTTLTQEGQRKKLATLAAEILKEFAFVADPLRDTEAAVARLMHLMLDPITAKPKGDATMIFLREQEIRSTLSKSDAPTAYLRALESDDLETVRAILDAPGQRWVSDDIKQRGQDEYARRTNPNAWEQVQSLLYFADHLRSLVAQVRQWFQALGASQESIEKALGD